MSPFAGPLFAAALLLLAAGAIKAIRPGSTRMALRTAGLPNGPTVARLVGAGEVAVALYALVFAGRLGAAAIAAAYLAFAVFAERLRRAGRGAAPCGCFGATSAPVGVSHVAINLVVVATAVGAIAWPSDPAVRASTETPLGGAVFAGFTVLLAWLVLVALTVAPELAAAARPRRAAIR